MEIAIISDTHDNLATLEKFLNYIKKDSVSAIIHCGDIAEGETLEFIIKKSDCPILAAFGNMDYRDSVQKTVEKYPKRILLFKNFGQAEFDRLEIGFCHHKETALQYLANRHFDFIFYGHTHKPWLEKINNCLLANPGTLAGLFYEPSFATLDTTTQKLDLHLINHPKAAH